MDEWSRVEVPPPPKLAPVTLDPSRSALLILDVLRQNCTAARRPRAAASVPRIRALLEQARGKNATIAFSLFPSAAPSDILAEVAFRAGEPVVTSGPDKFLGTELEKVLRDRGVETVVVVGSAAHGAVLHTAAAAAFRGFRVVVPVDGMSADSTYAEQYTAWHLANAPVLGERVTLTLCSQIDF